MIKNIGSMLYSHSLMILVKTCIPPPASTPHFAPAARSLLGLVSWIGGVKERKMSFSQKNFLGITIKSKLKNLKK